jgi:lipopolysaccharide/colanic/teichoic acid biosynthesis glycosyltransferase
MAFVGPRPEVPKYTEYYTDIEKKIFIVRPGITDYASIKYREESEILGESLNPELTYVNEIMRDKISINLEYIEKISILENLKIIFLTIKIVFFKRDSN